MQITQNITSSTTERESTLPEINTNLAPERETLTGLLSDIYFNIKADYRSPLRNETILTQPIGPERGNDTIRNFWDRILNYQHVDPVLPADLFLIKKDPEFPTVETFGVYESEYVFRNESGELLESHTPLYYTKLINHIENSLEKGCIAPGGQRANSFRRNELGNLTRIYIYPRCESSRAHINLNFFSIPLPQYKPTTYTTTTPNSLQNDLRRELKDKTLRDILPLVVNWANQSIESMSENDYSHLSHRPLVGLYNHEVNFWSLKKIYDFPGRKLTVENFEEALSQGCVQRWQTSFEPCIMDLQISRYCNETLGLNSIGVVRFFESRSCPLISPSNLSGVANSNAPLTRSERGELNYPALPSFFSFSNTTSDDFPFAKYPRLASTNKNLTRRRVRKPYRPLPILSLPSSSVPNRGGENSLLNGEISSRSVEGVNYSGFLGIGILLILGGLLYAAYNFIRQSRTEVERTALNEEEGLKTLDKAEKGENLKNYSRGLSRTRFFASSEGSPRAPLLMNECNPEKLRLT